MRALIFATSALAAGVVLANPPIPAKAQGFDYPYCTSGGWATDNICRFYTLEQCMAFVQGVGGSCVQNPRAAQYPATRYPRAVQEQMRPRR
jgi:hypothetical protein